MDSTYADALNHRGASKTNLGDDESAIDDLDQAIRHNPKMAEAYTNRGFAFYNLEIFNQPTLVSPKPGTWPADADKYFNHAV